ncbi:MAG: ABC transporter substrate-binding protein [Bacteroidota bacterium]|nr:ABC transporter substrate-binding protein [Bacteroidota bacterium]
MKKISLLAGFLVILLYLFGCNNQSATTDVNIEKLSWPQIEQIGKGKAVTMVMSVGSKGVNKCMNEFVIPELLQRFGIKMNIINGQGKEIVSNIMSEKEAGKAVGQADLCWINGETFYQLRQIDGLFGPYTDKLPNSKFVDYSNPIIKYDFQEEVKGYETPWSLAAFSLIYDSARVKQAPVSMQDFEQYWKAHPGKFTIPNDFSGLTLIKTWLIELAGKPDALDGKFDQHKYDQYSQQLWSWLNKNKQYFWKKGETFPANNTLVSQMFANGELDFALSFSVADIDLKIAEGVYPATSKPLILKAGSIQNANYIGITANSAQKAAAMVVCNFLISPEAQAKKADLNFSGAHTVLSEKKLSSADQERFNVLATVKHGLQPKDLEGKAIKEPAPMYMIKVSDDFRKKVIEAR